MSTLYKLRTLALGIVVALSVTVGCSAENPIIQTNFTADPAPLVYNGTVYLYTSHDEDDATGFKMLNWKLYTSADMVNWTDHGTVASLAIFPWAMQSNDAWAPQAIERNGKFYLYVPISVPGWPKNVIAVAVADSPFGPFKDVLGHPLIDKAIGNIDPTVFIDDDGQAYLYWGNPNLWYVKLHQDMISYSGDIVKVDSKAENYQEGPWFYKHNGKYYLAYASHCCPEGIGYAMSNSPTGPWLYKGMIIEPDGRSSGNHPGIIDYKGSSYVFGFNYTLNFALTNVHRERRSITLAKFSYNPDGTISTLPWWSKEGVPQVGALNPFVRVEAETMAWESGPTTGVWTTGVRTAQDDKIGVYVTRITSGDFIKVRGVDFGNNQAASFTASVASGSHGGTIEMHLDNVDGPEIGSLPVSSTGGWHKWQAKTTTVSGANGKRDLYFLFRGETADQLFNFDYWKFNKKGAKKPKS
jgi:arabinoxylan arabinofuranohydrolase